MSEAQFHRPATVFCDFDGTMILNDCVVSVWRRFAAPGWERVVEEMVALRKPLREGVPEVFATVPSAVEEEIVAHVLESVRFRPGLSEFLQFCKESQLSFVVVSGGLDLFMQPVLAPFGPLVKAMHTLHADLSGPTIRLLDTLDCPRCSVCKSWVMDQYPGVYRIFIGDGVTDLHGAEDADLVLARGDLHKRMELVGQPHERFEDFFEAREVLQRHMLQAVGQ